MNILRGIVTNIKVSNDIKIVDCSIFNYKVSFFLIENEDDGFYPKKDREIKILFKENQVIIAKTKVEDISIPNCLPCKILSIEEGENFARIYLKFQIFKIQSVITKDSYIKLSLKNEDTVWIYIKCNEILLLREENECA